MAESHDTGASEWKQLDWIDGYRFGGDGRIQTKRKACRGDKYTDE